LVGPTASRKAFARLEDRCVTVRRQHPEERPHACVLISGKCACHMVDRPHQIAQRLGPPSWSSAWARRPVAVTRSGGRKPTIPTRTVHASATSASRSSSATAGPR
jgi:hypothetical protein